MTLEKPVLNIFTHILDDNKDFRFLLSKILDKHPDIEYRMYSDINKFLKEVKETKNISIIDYNLHEDINGLQLSKIIIENNPLSYVIMLSDQSDVDVVIDFYESQGFRYINKSTPNLQEKLIETINKAKIKIQQHLDFHFKMIENYNETKEIIKDARNNLSNTLGGNT